MIFRGVDGVLYNDLARENMESFARVGRHTVRVPFYSREVWMAEHPGLGSADYLDWLLLLDMLEDQVREEGFEVEEVPFSPGHYEAWLQSVAACDAGEARAAYLRGLSPTDVRMLQGGVDLRPQAPVAQATTAAVFLLPVAVAEGTVGLLGRLGAKLTDKAAAAIVQIVKDSLDLDLNLEVLSPVRSRGVSVHVYPRLVSAADFDGAFGSRYLEWLKASHQAVGGQDQLSRRLPRARRLAEVPTDCLGLCIAVFGASVHVERFDAISIDEVYDETLSSLLGQGIGLGTGVLECADTFSERGRGVESCMEFMGCILEDAVEAGTDGLEDEPEDDDFRLLSLLQRQPEPPQERMGVLIPFRSRDMR